MKDIFFKVIGFLMPRGRILFAFAFLTPLFAQIMERAGFVPPMGLPPLVLAALVAGALGVTAYKRGRWT